MFDKLFARLKPAIFRYNDIVPGLGNKRHIGVMAQDILDGLEDEGFDSSEFSIVNKSENGYFNVDYTQLIPILISRVKRLEEEVSHHNNEYIRHIEMLTNKVKMLEYEINQQQKNDRS